MKWNDISPWHMYPLPMRMAPHQRHLPYTATSSYGRCGDVSKHPKVVWFSSGYLFIGNYPGATGPVVCQLHKSTEVIQVRRPRTAAHLPNVASGDDADGDV